MRLENNAYIRIHNGAFRRNKFTISFAFRSWDSLRRGRWYRIAYLPIGEMRIYARSNGLADLWYANGRG